VAYDGLSRPLAACHGVGWAQAATTALSCGQVASADRSRVQVASSGRNWAQAASTVLTSSLVSASPIVNSLFISDTAHNKIILLITKLSFEKTALHNFLFSTVCKFCVYFRSMYNDIHFKNKLETY
jgi:hypothetical protein